MAVRSRASGAAAGAVGQEVGEGAVLAAAVETAEDAVDLGREAVEAAEPAALGAPVVARDVEVGEAGLAEDALGQRRVAVDELGAQLEGGGKAGVAMGEDAPADAVPGLEDGDPEAPAPQLAGRREPGGAGAHHRDVDVHVHALQILHVHPPRPERASGRPELRGAVRAAGGLDRDRGERSTGTP